MSTIMAFIIGFVVGDVVTTATILCFALCKTSGERDSGEEGFYEPSELDIPLEEDEK